MQRVSMKAQNGLTLLGWGALALFIMKRSGTSKLRIDYRV